MKNLEITDLKSKVEQADKVADDYRQKFEALKKDMVSLKRQIDQGKEA